ncbi:WecB/TagA/CpsF family glycosyltransferase [Romeria aff. gracilis LEGE 07310]|uniref:WecB/TagA/CpsF family glycosyltransferase n=1 Tax=Vasconcelosia minhoensis LEGE 07310 TaxID=915328 RepID=A0A8J7AJ58_9CYAN|nr:WecB/TagA/CpsF family glycosyltransferase [Romeria gracilis]MBE9080051.1 WecB/TagA/CpsF family glycosyltransferase [Romeria aff. gracilis LEGE 07310]
MQLPKVSVTGSPVTALPFKEQISIMVAWAKHHSSRMVCVANVHMLMESRGNSRLRPALESADLVAPDGMPLVWVMRSLGVERQDRVAGMDIFLALCQESVKFDIPVFLLGSTWDVLDKMKVRLKHEFPNLKLAGMESPPFRELAESEDAELIERINNSGAGFTFVSLGCPKQECWMADRQGKIKSVMVGIGGVFPVYAGMKKHAPNWIRNNGLEWLYRLVQEPRRLWKRYFTTIPPFVWLALQQVSGHRKVKPRRMLRF